MIAYIRDRAQLTIPNEIVQSLNLKSGDMLDISISNDQIVLKPVMMIDKSQAWFWTKKWQDAEKEAQKDIGTGKVYSADTPDDLLRKLNK
jgi:AbrB family looped-hinge helix DNA binding protein